MNQAEAPCWLAYSYQICPSYADSNLSADSDDSERMFPLPSLFLQVTFLTFPG